MTAWTFVVLTADGRSSGSFKYDRRPNDVVTVGAIFMRIPGGYGVLPLVVRHCDCQHKLTPIIVGFLRDIL